jgi:hypothetical protein
MYAFPYIGNIKIGEIRHPDIVRLLEPIWLTKAETAKRTRQRIESVFDFAAAHGIFDRANPANKAVHKQVATLNTPTTISYSGLEPIREMFGVYVSAVAHSIGSGMSRDRVFSSRPILFRQPSPAPT